MRDDEQIIDDLGIYKTRAVLKEISRPDDSQNLIYFPDFIDAEPLALPENLPRDTLLEETIHQIETLIYETLRQGKKLQSPMSVTDIETLYKGDRDDPDEIVRMQEFEISLWPIINKVFPSEHFDSTTPKTLKEKRPYFDKMKPNLDFYAVVIEDESHPTIDNNDKHYELYLPEFKETSDDMRIPVKLRHEYELNDALYDFAMKRMKWYYAKKRRTPKKMTEREIEREFKINDGDQTVRIIPLTLHQDDFRDILESIKQQDEREAVRRLQPRSF